MRPRSVDRVALPSRTEFVDRWFTRGDPVVITHGAEDWPARHQWSLADLRARFGDRTVDAARTDARGHLAYSATTGVPREPLPLREYLDDLEAGRVGHYLVSPVHERLPELLDDVRFPRFAPDPRWQRSRFWLGPAGTVSPLHTDVPENFLVQFVGRKRVVLFPRAQSWRMYPHAPWSQVPNYSRVDAESPDLHRFPRFAGATRYECVIGPGEMLFIPSLWWHQVRSLDVSMSLNLWWAVGVQHALVQLALLAQRVRGLRW